MGSALIELLGIINFCFSDSGSRDEGIHIPRRKSVAFARSLPIRVPSDFNPSFRLFDDRVEDNKSKPNYKQKVSCVSFSAFIFTTSFYLNINFRTLQRRESPHDIAASIQALANSLHGDAIFGDLPRRKAGFRI